jgi:aspartate carbamoyltransferase regulatory subunit
LQEKQKIREHVLQLANNRVIKGFYPTVVSKRLNVNLSLVEEVLDEMVEEGLVKRKYELLCHNDNCLSRLDVVEDRRDFKDEYVCKYCGEEMEEVSPVYIQEIYSGKDK